MTIVVEPGEIQVSGIDVMVDDPSAKVWHIDLATKYAAVLAYSTDRVFLWATEDTLWVDENRRGMPTALVLGLPDDWNVIVDCARYTCRIVGYQTASPIESVEVNGEDCQ